MCFQIIAAVVLLVFYGCYFGKVLMQRRQGIQTDQMGKGKKGYAKAIEVAMKLSSVSVVLAEIVSMLLNTTALHFALRCIGAVLSALGAALFLCSVYTMRDSWRAGVSETDKTELVTEGVYQISRNPAFLGFYLVYIGFVLMFFNWILLALSVLAILLFHLQITKVEERFLARAFGSAYLSYTSRVCRYLGRKTSDSRKR